MPPVISAPGWAPNDPAWQSTPVFGGDPPTTFQALISECDDLASSLNWRFISPHHAMEVFDRWKRVMSGLSTDPQLMAPDVLPKPDPHRRGFVMHGPHAPVASVLGARPNLLRNHAQAVKNWCLAMTSQSTAGGRTRSSAASVADGPHPPNCLVLNGRETTLEPVPWRLVECIWGREMALEIDVCNYVWSDGDVADNSLKIAITKANRALEEVGADWTLRKKNGYVCKKFRKGI